MPTDSELLARVSRQDRTAFADLYDRYAARAFGLVLQLLRNRADAEDVLQETFLQVWADAGRFDPARASAEAWVLLLARSRALDRVRRRHLRATEELPDPPADPEACPAERREDAERAAAALAALPADQREPIRLAYYDGMSHDEIARHLHAPLGTVKTRIRLGMIRLRDRFARPQEPRP